ncbi:MAG: queuosine salvage family protein [Myxococcota bacterium]
MRGDVFTRIRRACARVVRRARRVRVDEARLVALADELAQTPPPVSHLDPARAGLADADTTLAYVVVLDAINFGSGYFPYLKKRPGCSGYFTVAAALSERFQREGAWRADELAALSARDMARVLGQDTAVPEVAELMELFARALTELGRFALERYDGRLEGAIAEADGSAARLVEILAAMPPYRDVASYAGEEVPFYKRAQLTAADLAAAFRGEGYGRFRDLDHLTLFADNLVPHVLRREGVLVYDPELARQIDAGELVDAGSPEEVEIRAAAVHAVERCVETLRARGVAATAHELDSVLWTRGQRPEMKAHPRHRTRTTYY